VKSDFETVRRRSRESLWHRLQKKYPEMPHAYKNEVHRRISSMHSNPARKYALTCLEITIYAHVRDRYTPFKSLNIYDAQNREAISEAHQRVKKILASWRGED